MLQRSSAIVGQNGTKAICGKCIGVAGTTVNGMLAASFSTSTDSSEGGGAPPLPNFKPRKHIPVTPRVDDRGRKGPIGPRHYPSRSKAIFTFNPHDHPNPIQPTDTLGDYHVDMDDPLEREYGPHIAEAIKYENRQRERAQLKALAGTKLANTAPGEPLDEVEEYLRAIDYMTSADGSTEDLVGARKALADLWDNEDDVEFETEINRLIEEERIKAMDLGDDDGVPLVENDKVDEKPMMKEGEELIRAHGEWSETVIKVDRVQKVQRGGTMVRYRALVVGGNTNGCAGFGVAKASSPNEAVTAACRMTRRNIFFVDRYDTTGLTTDLAGRHNSCKVILRSTTKDRGLSGHPLISVILKYFGISDCASKSYGNRNMFNVVRATFKALQTHESLEEIAMKRGKRLIPLDRARRLLL
mmetsp:Transcript_18500/g.25455  ORF Transcript_18500/g.25455 Transcript_18500/m.25455 type:complete len:414 (-) Transcript_18500:167-1408(-)|eukprot:CAMPEP_0185731040 /NCGR_PEP_ID=MMETSP1171-20130828/11697_1 /TAXON_ID=374046 /ORGANISM="Helicotheca tamensis, Strain CCMP826" /LENGTH=413 /DNA_ID=CAMNT_0028400209 /DNA_START=87 /DNA_END=1328 /DNA_ORIENTATION=+